MVFEWHINSCPRSCLRDPCYYYYLFFLNSFSIIRSWHYTSYKENEDYAFNTSFVDARNILEETNPNKIISLSNFSVNYSLNTAYRIRCLASLWWCNAYSVNRNPSKINIYSKTTNNYVFVFEICFSCFRFISYTFYKFENSRSLIHCFCYLCFNTWTNKNTHLYNWDKYVTVIVMIVVSSWNWEFLKLIVKCQGQKAC